MHTARVEDSYLGMKRVAGKMISQVPISIALTTADFSREDLQSRIRIELENERRESLRCGKREEKLRKEDDESGFQGFFLHRDKTQNTHGFKGIKIVRLTLGPVHFTQLTPGDFETVSRYPG